MRRLIRRPRIIVSVLVVPLVLAGGWYRVSSNDIRAADLAQLRVKLPLWRIDGRDERVLIVAPHCDDEVLGCGGLIAGLVKQGTQVKVVIVTNGDGCFEVVNKGRRQAPAEDYIKFGYRRQQESLRALHVLGVPARSVVFLGYPDRGLSTMWLHNWTADHPFTSEFTRVSHSPYSTSFRKNAPYCGSALLSDLEAIIASYRPTSIYYPHPNDDHLDHAATRCYVVQALYETGLLGKVRSGMYMVHRGTWPVPPELNPTLALPVPAELVSIGTRWYGFSLGPQQQAAKLRAARMYASQIPRYKDFIDSFDRRNELFGDGGPGTITRVGSTMSAHKWSSISPCVCDPTGDSIKVRALRGGDIRSLKCYADAGNVYVRVELAAPRSRLLRYGIRLHPIPTGEKGTTNVVLGHADRVEDKAKVIVRGNIVEAAVPLSEIGKWKALMVEADVTLGHRKVDNSAWQLLMPKK